MFDRVALIVCGYLAVGSAAWAGTTGITPTKLILMEKGGKAKAVFLAKDPGVTKGAGGDVATVSAQLDVAWDATSGTFTLPAAANDGTRGWLANDPKVAKYASKSASAAAGDTVKVALVKPGKLIKLVAKGLGDGPVVDLFDAPTGTVSACFTITNGIERHRFGMSWPAASCVYKETDGGAGRQVVCKEGGQPDPTCAASDVPCLDTLASTPTAPASLAETGLHAEVAAHAVAAHAEAYTPSYPLWSDDAAKSRWMYLPECAQIDTSDMDEWDFPVGARAWKEFALDGKRLETRLVHRYGPGANDFLYATYAWNDDESEAVLVTGGVEDARGTEHDVPPASACGSCHGDVPGTGGTPARYLGFSAIQLSHAGPGLTMATLSAGGALTHPAPAGFAVPGTPVERDALGYLHANCGNCHNDTANGLTYLGMDMRVSTTDVVVGTTGVYTDVVNQPVLFYAGPSCTHRVAGMDVGDSCLHFRMSERGSDSTPNPNQMPPLASDLADTTALAAIEAWIGTLPPP
jgi:hypothetical protein